MALFKLKDIFKNSTLTKTLSRIKASFLLIVVSGCVSQDYPLSDHYDGKTFYSNPRIESLSWTQIAGHILWGRNGEWPDSTVDSTGFWSEAEPQSICVTWIGHATALIQMGDFVILTDPVWSDRVGPVSWFGPKRLRAPGISLKEIPRVDLVMISHDHYDHLDLPTLKAIADRFHLQFVVPLGVEQNLSSIEGVSVTALDWWESHLVKGSFKVNLVPAQHNSGRWLFDQNKTLWGGFVVQGPQGQVFYAGDTAWGDHFLKINERLGPMQVALLPIGAYEPQEKMSRFHMNPFEAVRVAEILKSELVVPVHYDTFQLTAENYEQPLRDLAAALKEKQDLQNKFVVLKPSERTCKRFVFSK